MSITADQLPGYISSSILTEDDMKLMRAKNIPSEFIFYIVQTQKSIVLNSQLQLLSSGVRHLSSINRQFNSVAQTISRYSSYDPDKDKTEWPAPIPTFLKKQAPLSWSVFKKIYTDRFGADSNKLKKVPSLQAVYDEIRGDMDSIGKSITTEDEGDIRGLFGYFYYRSEKYSGPTFKDFEDAVNTKDAKERAQQYDKLSAMIRNGLEVINNSSQELATKFKSVSGASDSVSQSGATFLQKQQRGMETIIANIR